MPKIDHTNWDELIDLAIADLTPCALCGSGEYRVTPGGQTWMGQGNTAPQYFTMLHWCAKPADDPFVSTTMSLRCRSLDDILARWKAPTP